MLHRSKRNGVLKSLAYKTAVVAIALIGTLFVATGLEQNQLLAGDDDVAPPPIPCFTGVSLTTNLGVHICISGSSSANNVGSAFYTNLAETRVRFQVGSRQRTFNVEDVTNVNFFGGANDDFFENMTRIEMKISGEAGDDTLIGGSGFDIIDGGDGDDVIVGGGGNDTITGGLGADDIEGGDGDDQIFTNDFLLEPDGANNIVDPGAGLDRIDEAFDFDGPEILLYGEASLKLLIIQGDSADNFVRIIELGDQRIRVESDFMADQFFMPGEVDEILFKGLDGDDTFINNTHIRSTAEGFDGADRLFGGSGSDALNGGHGDDVLQGREGPDALGELNYQITPFPRVIQNRTVISSQAQLYRQFFETCGSWRDEHGDDNLIGGSGGDKIRGGPGNDRLIGESGPDLTEGGPGDDFHLTSGVNDIANGGDGDTFMLNGGTVNANGSFIVIGSALPETVNLIDSFSGSMIDMGGGDDTITSSRSPFGQVVLSGTHFINMGDGDDRITLFTPFEPSTGTLRIFCGAGEDLFSIHANGDVDYDTRINGGDGDDGIFFTGYAAVVFGGDGDDVIRGSFLTDTIYGQDGNDQISGSASFDVVGGDYLYGGDGNDVIVGSRMADTILGQRGNDRIIGSAGDDFLSGGLDDDEIFGREGDDELLGQQGDDFLDGGPGNDILSGGPGNDEEIQ